jgi:hypothetical protein
MSQRNMEPKETTTSALVPKKLHNQPTTPPVVEETKEVVFSSKRFPRDYILSRNPSSTHVHLHKEARYPLIEPPIPGVIIEGGMLGMISTLKYVDHDIIDESKFSELIPSKFPMKFISFEIHMIVIEPDMWDRGL